MSASPTLQIVPSDVQAWRDGLARLKPSVPPCPGMTASGWAQMHAVALEALDQFADDLVVHGWTTAELFAVHPKIGTMRVDTCGAFVIGGRRTTAVRADRIEFGLTTYYRNVPGAGVGIPVWDFRW
ncbi:hypothetical protein [Methylobacterium planeticum]|uniref:Uncharacterized protein n=1 Tax=Methylobacterium planeticum TaxID=2615211 RepID=A0A6N6MI94_9HYPH|nr:hypothetical protein [Methylobacterium planeticum]KAB1068748.1 hypothetical protein F6X51_26425 [Methylobacterium planeticum]